MACQTEIDSQWTDIECFVFKPPRYYFQTCTKSARNIGGVACKTTISQPKVMLSYRITLLLLSRKTMWSPESGPFFFIARIQGMKSTDWVLSIFIFYVCAFNHAKVLEPWSFLTSSSLINFISYQSIEREQATRKNPTPWEAQWATCLQVCMFVLMNSQDQFNFLLVDVNVIP